MPNRILRDWTDSEIIDELTIFAERFFTRLIMKVDDYGRYSANIKILKSTLFPLKTDIRETDISLWLAECKQCGLIAVYHVASKEYIQIENFKQVLRQKNEKYPAPLVCLADDKHMLSICEHERKGKETKRNEVEDGRSLPLFELFKRVGPSYDDDFLKHEVQKFLVKYPGTVIDQCGGLVNSWVGRLNIEEQKKWKQATKEEKKVIKPIHETTSQYDNYMKP